MDTREFCHCSAVCTAGIRTIRMQHVLIINSRDNPDGYFDPIIERPSLQYARFTEHSSFHEEFGRFSYMFTVLSSLFEVL